MKKNPYCPYATAASQEGLFRDMNNKWEKLDVKGKALAYFLDNFEGIQGGVFETAPKGSLRPFNFFSMSFKFQWNLSYCPTELTYGGKGCQS